VDFGVVGAGGEVDAEFGIVAWLEVVLGEALTDFGGGVAHDGVLVGVVVGRAAEDLGADDSLFQMVEVAVDGGGDDVLQEGGAAAAGAELRRGEEAVQLGERFGDGRRARDGRRRHNWGPTRHGAYFIPVFLTSSTSFGQRL
jgi:hypothetical protein